MTQYSQRDNRWKDIKLGFSNLTIGGYGCLITSIGNAIDTTPDVVNTQLKKVNGFAPADPVNQPKIKTLVDWTKINLAFPHLKFVWRSKVYDNKAVLSQIKRNGFCVVEVRTWNLQKHWVLFIGNQKMIDPWYGAIRSTSSYPACIGFAAIDKIA